MSRLEHPYIVPLYDYWRQPGGAFLVMRWLRGGTLGDRLAEGQMSMEEMSDLVSKIGSALAYAHRRGVVHGDLKPSNILYDDEAVPYLTDFGIARRFESGPNPVVEEVAEFASLVTRCLPETSTASEILDRALSDRAFNDMVSFLAAWESATTGTDFEAARSRFTETRNPYKGLAAFGENDAADFHGRGDVVEDLVGMIAESKFLAVAGPSGIGKSSVVRAGLIPALRSGAAPGSDLWLITDMLPGAQPFRELERALGRVAVRVPNDLREGLVEENPAVVSQIAAALPTGSELLLVVDQFEELFTMTPPNTTARFLELLTKAVENDLARVIITVRADYLDHPLRYSGFVPMLRTGIVTVGSPTKSELSEIVTEPAAGVGVQIEPSLVESLVDDVHDRPGALPLLQHALTELFEERTSDVLGVADYERAGGVTGTLARRAEAIYEELDSDERSKAKQVFLRLVTLADESTATRKRLRISEMEHLDASDVIDAFARRRLLVFDRDPTVRTPTVEVAHESLFTNWPRLAGWIEDLQQDLVLRRRLDESIHEWVSNDRAESYLLTGGRLAQHQDWTAETELKLTDSESEYLTQSDEWDSKQVNRRRRIRNAVLAGFALVAVIASLFAFSARQNSELARSRELAASAIAVLDEDPELSVLLALEASTLADQPISATSALHEAMAAYRKTLAWQWPADEPAFVAQNDLSSDGSKMVITPFQGTGFKVIDAASGEEVWSWEVPVSPPSGYEINGVFINGGSEIAVGLGRLPEESPEDFPAEAESWLGVVVFDAESGEIVRQLQTGDWGVPRFGHFIGRNDNSAVVEFGTEPWPESGFDQYGPPHLLDLNTLESKQLLAEPIDGWSALSDDGRLYAYWASLSEAKIIDTETLVEVASISAPNASGGILDFSPNGNRLLAGSVERWVFDTATGEPMVDVSLGARGGLHQAWFTPDGRFIYEARSDGSIRFVDSATGLEADRFFLASGAVGQVAMTADSSVISANNIGRQVFVFENRTVGPAELGNVVLCEFPQLTLSVEVSASAGAAHVLCGQDTILQPRTVLFDPDELSVTQEIPNQGGLEAAVSSGGSSVLVQNGNPDGSLEGLVLRDPITGEIQQQLEGMCMWEEGRENLTAGDCVLLPDLPFADFVEDLAFSPDDSIVMMASQYHPYAIVWDTGTGEVIAVVGDPDPSFHSTPTTDTRGSGFQPIRRTCLCRLWATRSFPLGFRHIRLDAHGEIHRPRRRGGHRTRLVDGGLTRRAMARGYGSGSTGRGADRHHGRGDVGARAIHPRSS